LVANVVGLVLVLRELRGPPLRSNEADTCELQATRLELRITEDHEDHEDVLLTSAHPSALTV